MADLEGKLGTEEASLLGNIGSIAAVVSKLLAAGVSAGDVAEHIASVLDPAVEPDIAALVSVLTEAQGLLSKVGG